MNMAAENSLPAAPVRLPLAKAERIAQQIRTELAPWCEQIEIAGSIRRRRPDCGDIDLVCLPKSPGCLTRILERCGRNARKVKHGEQYIVFELANGFQLDLWLAHPGGPDPSSADLFEAEKEDIPGNFGVLLLARTGSAMFNVWIAQTAKAAGLHFNPHAGISRGKRIIAATEEPEIFAALGLDFIPPENRER